MNYKNQVLTLDDNKEYLVIAHLNDNGRDYLYLSNKDDDTDTFFCEIDKEGNIKDIDSELFKNRLSILFDHLLKEEV